MKTLTMIISVIGILLVTTVPRADAVMRKGMDLEICRFKNGDVISQPLCEKLRISESKQAVRKENLKIEDAALNEIRKQDRERRETQKTQLEESTRAIADQRAREEAAIDAKWAEEKKKRLAEEAQDERDERTRANKRNAAIKSKKEICGDDYASPKIGMTLARAQQCVSKFRLSSQINRADGVISMYVGGGFYLHVMSGRIVAWTR